MHVGVGYIKSYQKQNRIPKTATNMKLTETKIDPEQINVLTHVMCRKHQSPAGLGHLVTDAFILR